jgi:hypothetical protein
VNAVLRPLAVPDQDLPIFEVDIFDPKLQALGEAQPRSIEKACHQPLRAPGGGKQPLHFASCEHRRQPRRALRSLEVVQPRQRLAQHLLVEKHERGKRLVLRRCRHVTLASEVVQKDGDLHRAQTLGMPLPGEIDKAPYPIYVDLLGAVAVVAPPYGVAYAVE